MKNVLVYLFEINKSVCTIRWSKIYVKLIKSIMVISGIAKKLIKGFVNLNYVT